MTPCRSSASPRSPRLPGPTWPLEPGHYAEGPDAPGAQPFDTHPPLVRVIGFEGKPPEVGAAMLERVASTLARELGLEPGNVFAIYEDARSGRLFTGGSVLSD